MNPLLFTAFLTVLVLVFHCMVQHNVGSAVQRQMDRQINNHLAQAWQTWRELYARFFHPKRRIWRWLRRNLGISYQSLFRAEKPGSNGLSRSDLVATVSNPGGISL